MDLTENDASSNSSIVACVRCHGNVVTKPLPSNDKGMHIQAQTDGRDL
jgi:cytochrome c553